MDEVTLVIPVDRPFYAVARLVVGGLAARLDLSYDQLADLQLALDSVLEREEYAAGQDVTVRLAVAEDSVGMRVGPLEEAAVRADLDGDQDGFGLGRLLGTVAQRVALEEAAGEHWLVLEKRVKADA